MTPDDARLLASLRTLETRTTRAEASLRALTAKVDAPAPAAPEAYRETLRASATDKTLHDDYTGPPHVSPSETAQWGAAAEEVAAARTRVGFSLDYASLSLRLEAMEREIEAAYESARAGNVVIGEVPAGTVDGTNAVFTLANSPAQLALYVRNLRFGSDAFTIDGTEVTITDSRAVPRTGNTILADYTY